MIGRWGDYGIVCEISDALLKFTTHIGGCECECDIMSASLSDPKRIAVFELLMEPSEISLAYSCGVGSRPNPSNCSTLQNEAQKIQVVS